jgi:hypothetical protein
MPQARSCGIAELRTPGMGRFVMPRGFGADGGQVYVLLVSCVAFMLRAFNWCNELGTIGEPGALIDIKRCLQ